MVKYQDLFAPSELTALNSLTRIYSMLPPEELTSELQYFIGKDPPQWTEQPVSRLNHSLRDVTPPLYSVFVSASAS